MLKKTTHRCKCRALWLAPWHAFFCQRGYSPDMEERTMPQWRLGVPVLVATVVLLLAGSAAAEQMYAWRTDAGAYAFTDDPEAIPARYQDRAKRRETGSLDDYRRFTPADGRASNRYHQQLAARLDYLRAANGAALTASLRRVTAAPAVDSLGLTYRTGGSKTGGIDVSLPNSGEPIIVEYVWMRPSGKIVSQLVQVVRQGDRIIAINKPRSREWNPSDTVSEEELLAGEAIQ